jgi:hypothetical protein
MFGRKSKRNRDSLVGGAFGAKAKLISRRSGVVAALSGGAIHFHAGMADMETINNASILRNCDREIRPDL